MPFKQVKVQTSPILKAEYNGRSICLEIIMISASQTKELSTEFLITQTISTAVRNAANMETQ